jgi:hypothetical protein
MDVALELYGLFRIAVPSPRTVGPGAAFGQDAKELPELSD